MAEVTYTQLPIAVHVTYLQCSHRTNSVYSLYFGLNSSLGNRAILASSGMDVNTKSGKMDIFDCKKCEFITMAIDGKAMKPVKWSRRQSIDDSAANGCRRCMLIRDALNATKTSTGMHNNVLGDINFLKRKWTLNKQQFWHDYLELYATPGNVTL
jgi:hypothetical protein